MHNASYATGANLGGWLVLENWLFPNILLLRLGWGRLRSARPPRPEGSERGYSAGGTWRPWEKAKST